VSSSKIIVLVQVAVVLLSVVYLKVNPSVSPLSAVAKVEQRAARAEWSHPLADLDEEGPMLVTDGRRMGLGMEGQVRGPVMKRQMGYPVGWGETAPGGGMRRLGQAGRGGLPVARANPRQVAASAGGSDAVALGAEAETHFESIPDGAGYQITAQSASNFQLDEQVVVFSGAVQLVSETFTVKSDRLVVHFDKETQLMSRMVANGSVVVRVKGDSPENQFDGFSDEAEFDPAAERILLMGWPKILGQGREHRASAADTRMTLFTNPAKLVTEGRAQTRILSGQNLESLF
jgi:lipopolysaccharide transport protein LptA